MGQLEVSHAPLFLQGVVVEGKDWEDLQPKSAFLPSLVLSDNPTAGGVCTACVLRSLQVTTFNLATCITAPMRGLVAPQWRTTGVYVKHQILLHLFTSNHIDFTVTFVN